MVSLKESVSARSLKLQRRDFRLTSSHGLSKMHLSGTLLIIVALVAAETADPVRPRALTAPCLCVGAGCLLVIFAAAAISSLVATRILGNPSAVRSTLRRFSRLRKVHTCLWLAISSVGVLLLEWPAWVACELRPRFVLLDEMAVLLPVLAPMFLSHAAFYEVDRAAAVALRGGLAPRSLSGRWAYAWWFLRHEFGLAVVPLLVLALVRDVATALLGSAQPAVTAWAAGPVLLVVLAGFPLLLRRVWHCRPLQDAPLQQAIADECRAASRPVPHLVEWRTHGRVVNALVSGTLPGTHCVLLSDALLKYFSQEEILAVVRHELAHVWQHHVLLRVAALALPLLVCWNLSYQQGFAMGEAGTLMHVYAVPGGLGTAGIAVMALVLYAYFFGAFSRLLELEADLLSCGGRNIEPQRALSTQAALNKLGCVYGFDRRSWLHPPIRLRQRVLDASCRDPSLSDRIRRQIRRWKSAVGISFAVLILLIAVQGVFGS